MSWQLLLWSVPILINGFGRKNEKFGWVCKKTLQEEVQRNEQDGEHTEAGI